MPALLPELWKMREGQRRKALREHFGLRADVANARENLAYLGMHLKLERIECSDRGCHNSGPIKKTSHEQRELTIISNKSRAWNAPCHVSRTSIQLLLQQSIVSVRGKLQRNLFRLDVRGGGDLCYSSRSGYG